MLSRCSSSPSLDDPLVVSSNQVDGVVHRLAGSSVVECDSGTFDAIMGVAMAVVAVAVRAVKHDDRPPDAVDDRKQRDGEAHDVALDLPPHDHPVAPEDLLVASLSSRRHPPKLWTSGTQHSLASQRFSATAATLRPREQMARGVPQ